MKLNRHLVLGAIAGGGVIASVILAFKAGTKAERILRDEYGDEFEPTLWEKAKVILPSAAPAIIGAAVTGIAIVIEITGNKAKAEELKRRLDEGLRKGEAAQKRFDQYREALINSDGQEKDIKLKLDAAANGKGSSSIVEDDKVKLEIGDGVYAIEDITNPIGYRCRLNLLDKPIYFWTTIPKIKEAYAEMNRRFVDPNVGDNVVTVANFLEFIDQVDLITDEMRKYGWVAYDFNHEDVYWLEFHDTYRPDEGIIDIYCQEMPEELPGCCI